MAEWIGCCLYVRIDAFFSVNVKLKCLLIFLGYVIKLYAVTLKTIILNEFLRPMKDLVFAKFAKGSSEWSDAVYKGWMLEIIDLYKTEWPLFSQFY